MREYLFHGKKTNSDEWVEGYYCVYQGVPQILVDDCSWEPVELESVRQYTCMEDKNGRKIFEGDIVNCITSDFDGSDKYVYNLRITDIADFEQMGFLNFCNEIEIIGNIHDNADLLEG